MLRRAEPAEQAMRQAVLRASRTRPVRRRADADDAAQDTNALGLVLPSVTVMMLCARALTPTLGRTQLSLIYPRWRTSARQR